MKKIYVLSLVFFIGQLCYGQNLMEREYDYDHAGNRVLRKVLLLLNQESSFSNHKSASTKTDSEQDDFYADTMGEIALKVYPNPATSTVFLRIEDITGDIEGTIVIYNQSGSQLGSQRVSSYQTEIDMSAYSSGIYLLTIQINGRITNWKIIKQ